MGMLTKKAVTRCLAVCCPCSVLNCVNLHCLTSPLLSLLWFPLALVVVGLTPLLRLKYLRLLCGHFLVASWRWRDGKDGDYYFHLSRTDSSDIILIQVEFKTLSLIKNKSKCLGGKGEFHWQISFTWFKKLTFYNWVEELESWDQHYFALLSCSFLS